MSPPPADPFTLDRLAILGAITGPLIALWALLRWLFWPRVQTVIRDEVTTIVTGAVERLREETKDHLASMDRGITTIAAVAEAMQREVVAQGKLTAATAATVDLLANRRHGPDDRRRAATGD